MVLSKIDADPLCCDLHLLIWRSSVFAFNSLMWSSFIIPLKLNTCANNFQYTNDETISHVRLCSRNIHVCSQPKTCTNWPLQFWKSNFVSSFFVCLGRLQIFSYINLLTPSNENPFSSVSFWTSHVCPYLRKTNGFPLNKNSIFLSFKQSTSKLSCKLLLARLCSLAHFKICNAIN